MRTIVVEQPNYIPWLGYFDLMRQSDVWVWLDDVQYTKRDWRNRNRIAGSQDEVWLTIPVKTRGRYDQAICKAELVDHDWVRKHLRSVEHAYRAAPSFDQIFPLFREHLERRPALLVELTIPLAEDLGRLLGVEATFVRSSSLSGVTGTKQARLLEICAQFDCPRYLSGPAAQAYIDPDGFSSRGYQLDYMDYGYSGYPRGGGATVTNLSILDPLFWLGPADTRRLLEGETTNSKGDPWHRS